MSNPTTEVFIAFDLSALGGPFFTLDDNVRGVLDGTLFPLAGDVFIDVTEKVKSVSVSRGKSRELERFTAGNAAVLFDNIDRTFDPFFNGSPYVNQIVPKKQIKITSNGEDIFQGAIQDWNFTYSVSGQSEALIECADGFNFFSNSFITAHSAVPQTAGERINAILSRPEIAWPFADRDIDSGTVNLQGDEIDENTNTLSYLQQVELSEAGKLFMSKSNRLTFRDAVTIPDIFGVLVFSDDSDPDNVPYNDIEVIYGIEQLYNRVSVTNENGSPQIVDNLRSQGLYGVSMLVIEKALLQDDAAALDLAKYYLGIYQNPELRVNSVTVQLEALTTEQQNKILNLEINDVIQVLFTPNNIGNPIDRFGIIIGLEHDIRIDSHAIKILLQTAENLPLILDHPIYGRLGGTLPVYDDAATLYDSPDTLYDGTEFEGYILAF
jgi:hypothetical protein